MDFNFDLDIGLWNLWLPLLIYHTFSYLFAYFLDKEGFKRGANSSWLNKKDKPLMILSVFIFYATLLISISIPMKTENVLFNIGLGLFVCGMIVSTITGINYVTAPKDKVIVQGIYQFSRNPIYICNYLIYLSLIFMSHSWIFVILLIITVISTHFIVLLEEQYLEAHYGNEYIEYKQKVPRYFLFFR